MDQSASSKFMERCYSFIHKAIVRYNNTLHSCEYMQVAPLHTAKKLSLVIFTQLLSYEVTIPEVADLT